MVRFGDASLRLVSEWRSVPVEEVENEIDCKTVPLSDAVVS